eukprot:TRINITY_DN49638_c0_g1_i1.p1 TRINITY_DN49638_c0_g1~~TRINITY_DN49638_c0_g1_i1.p1  ORF type:complete len:101 (+),score=31.43 TRINITY_DN49638_c0_g1_i1:39-305(+)
MVSEVDLAAIVEERVEAKVKVLMERVYQQNIVLWNKVKDLEERLQRQEEQIAEAARRRESPGKISTQCERGAASGSPALSYENWWEGT